MKKTSFKEKQKELKQKKVQWENISASKWIVLGGVYVVLLVCAWQAFLPLKAEWHYREGFNYDAMGNKPLAVEKLSKAVAAAPWETQYEVSLGKAYEDLAGQASTPEEKRKALNEAEVHYAHILKISPLNPWYHNRIGEIYRQYSDLETDPQKKNDYFTKYKKELDIATAADPNNPLFRMSLGYFYHRMGQFDIAKATYERVLQGDPAFSEAYFNLSDIYRREGNEEKAKEMYEKLVETMPLRVGGLPFSNAFLNLGRYYFDHGSVVSAAIMFEKEDVLQPNNEAVLRNLAAAYQRMERWYDLIKVYHKILLINPKAADIHRYLSFAYYKVGKMEEAVAALELSLQIEPGNPEALRNLAVMRAQLRR